MIIKIKIFVLTFIFSILLNNVGNYINTNESRKDIFTSSMAYGMTVDYKVCPSCKIYFTHKVRKDIESSGLDLKTIQYYVSNQIILSRTISKEKHQASSGGVVKYRSGKLAEEINIRKFTPGICVGHNPKTLYMIFGKDKKFKLPFKKRRGYYELANVGDYVEINNLKFRVLRGRSAILIIQKYTTKTGKTKHKTLKGNLIKN